ncbi:MAG: glycosyltransferase family 4 protein [Patescibacteria group bacterium]
MKIAIFHNLKPGGGLNLINSLTNSFKKKGYKIDIFSHQKVKLKNSKNHFPFPIDEPASSFDHLIKATFTLKKSQRNISKLIIQKKYDYIFIFPCNVTQAPHILRFLPKEKTFYFFLEPKREFYEKTSFDYYTPKRFLSRLIRYLEKIIDQINCKACTHIISSSIFSQTNLNKIYKKNSVVIYPGMKPIKPKQITVKNNHKFLSFGLLTMLKGHHISAQIIPKISIYGQKSHENIQRYLPRNITIKTDVKEKDIKNIYKKHTFFLANQINEPFGLTTLEATSNNCYVFGKNEGGTPEIIKDGFNGTLISTDNIPKAQKIIEKFNKKKTITFKKTCIIDWDYTVDQILQYINNV